MFLLKEKIRVKRKNETIGLRFSTYSNLLFIVLELWIAYLANSRAVLIDGLFDACETVLLIFSIRIMKFLYKPISEKRPIGYSSLEPLYMILKGLLFCSIAALMAFSGIVSLFTGGYRVDMDVVLCFELFAGAYGIAAHAFLRHLNARAQSQILMLEIKEWNLDIFSSFGTGLAFLLALLARHTPVGFLSNYFDQIVTLAMVVYILPTPLRAMRSGFQELFFLSPSDEILGKVKATAAEVAGAHGIAREMLDFDVVKTGRRLWISVYVTPGGESVDVGLLRRIHAELGARCAPLADMVDVDVIPDIE